MTFLRDSLQVLDIDEESLLVLYNLEFTFFKYMNKKITLESLSPVEQKNAKQVRGKPHDLWVYVMNRVESDRRNHKDYDIIKSRFAQLLAAGSFEAQ